MAAGQASVAGRYCRKLVRNKSTTLPWRRSTEESAPNLQRIAARGDDHSRLRAQESVAANLLAAFDRLQQERVLLLRSQAQECPDRRQQIGAQRFRHRDERRITAELQEAFVVGSHHVICARFAQVSGIIREAVQSVGKGLLRTRADAAKAVFPSAPALTG